MAEDKKISVIKATLSTGKVVLLKEMKISHTEKACEQVAERAKDNGQLMQVLMQKELVKMLIVKVDEKTLTLADKDDLDSIFNVQEYGQVLKVVARMSGGDEKPKEAKIELVAAML